MEGYYESREEINERRGRLETEFERIFPKPEAPYEETARKIANESLKGYKPTSVEDATLFFMSSYIKSMFDVAVVESHHTGKADHPSGTALMIASRLIDAIDRKKRIVTGCPDGRIAEDVIEISSVRVGSEPGTHTLIMDGGADTIEITHKARSREGFASGAIMAAEWIVNRNNGIYTLDDFIQDISGGRI